MKKKCYTLFRAIISVILLIILFNCQTQIQSDKESKNDNSIGNYGIINTVDSSVHIGAQTSIKVIDSDIFISYHNETNHSLMFTKSTDGGATWPITNRKTVDSTGDIGSSNSMVVIDQNIYISYYDAPSNYDLKFAKSTDGGTTWPITNIKTIDSADGVGSTNSIGVAGSNIYISYYDITNGDLKMAKSSNYGNTWTAGNIKTVDSGLNVGMYTSITVSGSNVYISYYDLTNTALKFAKSIDYADTWDPSYVKTVDSGENDVGIYTSMAVNGPNIYISYYDNTNGDLKLAKSSDYGSHWTDFKVVDYIGNVGEYSSITVDNSNAYISYYDNTNSALKFAKSTDGGATWLVANIITIDSNGDVGKYSSIAVDGSNIYISYLDSTNYALKFAKSTDGGASW